MIYFFTDTNIVTSCSLIMGIVSRASLNSCLENGMIFEANGTQECTIK